MLWGLYWAPPTSGNYNVEDSAYYNVSHQKFDRFRLSRGEYKAKETMPHLGGSKNIITPI